MRSFIFVLLVLTLLAIQNSLQSRADPATVLIIGNSYVYFNNLPILFKNLSDVPFNVTSHTVGGESLCGHSKNAEVIDLMSKKWDYVVLQDHSESPCVVSTRNKALECLATFYRPSLEKTGTKNVILYQTWGRRAGDPHIGFNDFLSMQEELVVGYEAYRAFLAASKTLNVTVAPAGQSYREVYYKSRPNPLDPSSLFYRLYIDDGSHPNPLGSYIAACSLYMRIVGKSPVGLKFRPDGVTEQERDLLQKIVAQFL